MTASVLWNSMCFLLTMQSQEFTHTRTSISQRFWQKYSFRFTTLPKTSKQWFNIWYKWNYEVKKLFMFYISSKYPLFILIKALHTICIIINSFMRESPGMFLSFEQEFPTVFEPIKQEVVNMKWLLNKKKKKNLWMAYIHIHTYTHAH